MNLASEIGPGVGQDFLDTSHKSAFLYFCLDGDIFISIFLLLIKMMVQVWFVFKARNNVLSSFRLLADMCLYMIHAP